MKTAEMKIVKSKAKTEIVLVTPQVALEWLTKNTRNRPVRKFHVVDLAGRMKRGEWHMNGESIKFSVNGTLLDGQHRLEAILESECSVELMVVYDLPEETYETLDTGIKRTTADYFALQGEKYYKQLSGGLRYLFCFLGRKGSFKDKCTNTQLKEVLELHPNIRQSIEKGVKAKLLTIGISIALHYIFSTVDAEKADTFFSRLADGIDLSAGDPILQLRQRLLDAPRGFTMSKEMEAALTIKAWNLYVTGERSANLRWRQSGNTPETFPEIAGAQIIFGIKRKRKK